jgi:hypothetical protein
VRFAYFVIAELDAVPFQKRFQLGDARTAAGRSRP